MARRQLTLTLTLTLDEDAVRAADDVKWPDGSTEYSALLDEVRTTVHHHVALALTGLDPQLDPPEFEYRGVDYEPGHLTSGDVRDVGL